MALLAKDKLFAIIAITLGLTFAVRWSSTLQWIAFGLLCGASLAFSGVILAAVASSREVRSQEPNDVQGIRLTTPSAWNVETTWYAATSAYKAPPILPSSFIVSESLDELLSLVVRDFVTSWYRGISQSRRFAGHVDSLLRNAMVTTLENLQEQDVVELLVSRISPILTRHLQFFGEAERSVRGKKLNKSVTESEELDLAIAKRYNNGKLHPAASLASPDPELVRQEYLRGLVHRLMPHVIPAELLQCKPTSTLVRELLTRVLLGPILSLFSDPDTWNQILESYGRSVLHDRNTVRRLRAALDEHAVPTSKSPKPHVFPKLSHRDDERKFERFIRTIRLCNNLSDARRFRSEVVSQLTRESMQDEHDAAFLKRLETGRRLLDQKISTLTMGNDPAHVVPSQPAALNSKSQGTSNVILVDLLRDATGLSYFMEYMDRQKMMTLVQFWIVVDGFRDPLEDAPEGHDQSSAPKQWSESDRHDMAQILDVYLARPELHITNATRDAVQEFLSAKNEASLLQYGKARGALLRAQKAVQDEMQEKYLPSFRRSDLLFKYLASDSPSKLMGNRSKHEVTQTQIPPMDPDMPVPAQHPKLGRHPLADRTAAKKQPAKQTSRSSKKSTSRPDLHVFTDQRLALDNDELESPVEDERLLSAAESESANLESQPGSDSHVVEAVEAALNDILTDKMSDTETRDAPSSGVVSGSLSQTNALFPGDLPASKSLASLQPSKKEKPSIASLGLVSASSRIGVFMDDDLFGNEEKFIEDEHADPEGSSESELLSDIHEAAPGDLGLSEAIATLTVDIERLHAQESVVDALTRKAELTNNHSELRVLSKSRSSLQREVRRKELQKQQYVAQESDSSLYRRANVDIKSVMVGRDGDGQEFAFYMVEVSRNAGEHMPAASWVIARRYSEFLMLHQRLRRMYPAVRTITFPRRRLVMKLQTDFLQRRRMQLEEYLRNLLQLPAVCTSRALRAFLSQRPITTKDDTGSREEREDLVSRIYSSVTDGMDEFLGTLPAFDQLSIAGHSLVSIAASQINDARLASDQDAEQPVEYAPQEAQAEIEAYESQTFQPFVKPICDLFLEVFGLNQSANWLRGRTLVIVLQQLLGSTIERKVREVSKALTSDDALLGYVASLKDIMWPNGSFQLQRRERTAAEKKKARTEASIVLATLLPELAGGVVGRANAQGAGRRIFAAVNNSRLNTHLAFQLLDEITAILFPMGSSGSR